MGKVSMHAFRQPNTVYSATVCPFSVFCLLFRGYLRGFAIWGLGPLVLPPRGGSG